MKLQLQSKGVFCLFLCLVPIILLIFSLLSTSKKHGEFSYYSDYNEKHEFPTGRRNFNDLDSFSLHSKCLCQKEIVTVTKYKGFYNIRVSNIFNEKGNTTNGFFTYNVTNEKFESLRSCDLYKVLRRGPNQNVVSYSMRRKEDLDVFKSLYLFNVQSSLEKYYDGWTARVYHDTSQISQSDICFIECNNHRGTLRRINNVEFCNVNELPFDVKSTWDAGFMPEYTRRWLIFGDQFVDVFLSRDIDTCVFDREISAVNHWMKSGTLFHIMRDHPTHDAWIVPGLWGYMSYADRRISDKLFHEVIQNSRNQELLEKILWPHFVRNATIHDSFFCDKYGGEPFPLQRELANCFVGQFGCCGSSLNRRLPRHECPRQCRPLSKINDWNYC